jgi:exonuclease VII large subunit
MNIVSLETIGNNVARLIAVAAGELGKTEEKLENAKRAHDENQTLAYIKEELHYLETIESYLNGKTLRIVEDLRQMQGRITAKKVGLHTRYKELKLTNQNPEEQARLGKEIRELDNLIQEIQTMDEEIVSGSKRDISTMRLIMRRAGRKLDIFGWLK